MADYMEGIFEVSIEERPATRRRCSPSSSKSSTSPVPVMEQTKRLVVFKIPLKLKCLKGAYQLIKLSIKRILDYQTSTGLQPGS